MDPRTIQGYGDKYLVYPDGRVTRVGSDGEEVEVAQWGEPPRVTLYRLGRRWQPRVSTLLERVGFEK